jgi:hypothetical protein
MQRRYFTNQRPNNGRYWTDTSTPRVGARNDSDVDNKSCKALSATEQKLIRKQQDLSHK